MKIKISRLVNYKILIFLIGMFFCAFNFTFAYDLKEYYPLAEGNSWTYSVIDGEENYNETIKIEGKEIVNNVETVKMVYAENRYHCMTNDSEGVKIYKDFDTGEYNILNPPFIIFPNVDIGKGTNYSESSIRYNPEGAKIGEDKITAQILLDSAEDVTVSAGSFSNCLKFSFIAEYKEADGNYSKEDCSFWLAPVVGKVKEFCINTEYDAEIKKEETSIEMSELISAVVDGRKIGGQEEPTR